MLTDEQIRSLGYVIYKVMPDDTIAVVEQLTFMRGMIRWPLEVDAGAFTDAWTYPHTVTAAIALHAWNGEGEPDGWIRHWPSMRRRTRAGIEYVNPGDWHTAHAWLTAKLCAQGAPDYKQAATARTAELMAMWKTLQETGGQDE